MKVAVPVSGGRLAAHFGHCEQFALFDVDQENKRITSQGLVTAPEHQPGLLPRWLAQQGVSLVIAGGMGSRAINLFQESNISVVIGAMEEDPEKAVLDYLEGGLATGGNICDH